MKENRESLKSEYNKKLIIKNKKAFKILGTLSSLDGNAKEDLD